MRDEALTRALAAIVAEARAHVAGGRDPNGDALEARVRAAAARALEGAGDERAQEIRTAERRTLQQVRRIASVHRARTLVTREPQRPEPAPAPRLPRPGTRPGALRTRPTINANMDVRRDGDSALVWDRAHGVVSWEVRFSERPDPRRDYAVRETLTLPPETTRVEVPLGALPVRVHLLGRGRDGRLVRRAIVSGLTRAGWHDRWERRASAA